MTKIYREPRESIMSKKCCPKIATRLVNSVPFFSNCRRAVMNPAHLCFVLLLLLLLLFNFFCFLEGGGSFKTTF